MSNKFQLTAQLGITLPPAQLNALVNTINNKLRGVNINIGTNISPQAQAALSNINSNLQNVSKNAKTATGDIERFGASAAASLRRFAGFTIFASGFFTLTKAIKASLNEAIDFQRQVVRISQVTGTSVKDLSFLTDEVTRLSTSLGVSSKRLINVSQVLVQAGLSADETTKALQTLALTDISPTFENIESTTEGVIAIMSQFGTRVEDLEAQLGSLNEVSAKFAVESSDIITAVRRTGGAFQAAGGNLNELIALFTSVRATTRESAESIATGFRTIFTRLQRTRTIGFLETLGIQLRDLEGQFVGPFEAVRRLSTALNAIPSTDPRFAQVVEELGGFRQVSKVIPLIKEFATAQQALIVAQQGSTSLTEDAAKAQEALALRIQKIREEFEALIRKVSNNDIFQKMTDGALKLASALIKITDAIEPVLPLLSIVAGVKLAQFVPRFLSSFSAGIPGARGFASGGDVPGTGNGDTVPAMLTPGEFVINKDAVKKLGKGFLTNLNNTGKVQKFATGGLVGGGTNGAIRGVGLAALIIPAAINSFSKLDKETEQLTNGVQQAAATFLALNFALKQTQDSIVDFSKLPTLRTNRESVLGEKDASLVRLNDTLVESNNLDKKANSLTILRNNAIAGIQRQRSGINTLTGLSQQATPRAPAGGIFLGGQQFAGGQFIPRQLIDSALKQAQSSFTLRNVRLRDVNNQFSQANQDAAEARERLDIERKIQTQKQEELNALDDQIKSLERAEIAFNVLNNVVSVAAGAMIAFGTHLEQINASQLRSGVGSAAGGFARGRALQAGGLGASIGAGIGGLIGSAIGVFGFGAGAAPGGIAGTAIGASIGASVSSIVSFKNALEEATKILEAGQFERFANQFSKILESVQTGRSLAQPQVGRFVTGVRGLRERLAEAPLEDKEGVEGVIESSIIGIDIFLTKLAETSDNFEQLQGLVGQDVLKTFAEFTNVPFEEIVKRFRTQIDIQNKASNIQSALTREQENQIQRLREFNTLSGALQDTTARLRNFSGALDELDGFITGTLGRTSVVDNTDVLSRPGAIIDNDLLSTVVRQVTSGLGGRGTTLGSDAIAASQALSQLPNILLQIGSQQFGEGRDFVPEFEDVLRKQVRDIPEFVVQALSANARTFIGPEQKDEKILRSIQENPTKLAKELSEGVLDTLFNFLQTNAKILLDQTNQLAGLYEKRRQIESNFIDNLNTLEDIAEQRLAFSFERRGENVPIESSLFSDQVRLSNILGGDFGLSPSAIGEEVIASQNKVLELSVRLQEAEFSARADLLKEIEEEKSQIERLTSALKFHTDVTARNASLQKELERIQNQQRTKFDFAQSFLFANNEQRGALGRGALGAGLLSRTNDIDRIPSELRGDVLGFLEQFEDVPLSFLGGQRGRDVLRKTIESELIGAGLDPKTASEVALTSTTDAEQKIVDAINSNFEAAEAAQLALLDITKNTQVKLLENIDRNTSIFAALLERNFAVAERESLTTNRSALLGQNRELTGTRPIIGNIQGEIEKAGIAFNKTTFETIRQNLDKLTSINSLRGRIPANFDELSSQANFDKLDAFKRGSGTTVGSRLFLGEQIRQIAGQSTADSLLKPRDGGRLKPLIPVGANINRANFQAIRDLTNAGSSKVLGRNFFDDEFDKLFQTRDSIPIDELNSAISDRFRQIITEIGADKSAFDELVTDVGRSGNFGVNQVLGLASSSGEFGKLFGELPKDFKFQNLAQLDVELGKVNQQINNLTISIQQLNDKINTPLPTPIGRNRGGIIPGFGSRDTVPAMLTPGEFVINKDAASAIGFDTLENINRFARGGRVRDNRIARRRAMIARRQERRNFTRAHLGEGSGGFILSGDAARFFNAGNLERIKEEVRERRNISKARRFFERERVTGEIGAGRIRAASSMAALRERIKEGANVARGRRFLTIDAIRKQQEESRKSGASRFRFNTGGAVGGIGNTDTVPALLTPGEFVLNKGAASAIGVNTLNTVNNAGRRKFQNGGPVNSSGGSMSLVIASDTAAAMSNFGSVTQKLSTSLDNFPREISMNVRHTHEVIINGAEVLTRIHPEIMKIAEQTISQAMNKMIKTKFPDAGPMQ